MYEGLPITTNKMPLEERKGIPHHLLGCVKLGEEPWTVKQFVERATEIIRDIRSRCRLPILVGGTHYYIQSLLFSDALVEDGRTDDVILEKQVQAQAQKWQVLDASTGEMLKELCKVDPEMAMRWHPSDRRKIRRSLEICLKTGKKASDVYQQQKTRGLHLESSMWDASVVTDPPAQPHVQYNPLIFWVHASSAVLNSRLEARVDNMISNGLLEEISSMQRFLHEQEQQSDTIDQGRGIWVAIGYKEFLPYLQDSSRPEKLRQEGIERTKIATRQYAKRQIRWTRLRLWRTVNATDYSHMFLLDASDSSKWSDEVDGKAQDITTAFTGGFALPEPASLSDTAANLLVSSVGEARSARYCEVCDKTLMFHSEWINHLKSKGHRASIRPTINRTTF